MMKVWSCKDCLHYVICSRIGAAIVDKVNVKEACKIFREDAVIPVGNGKNYEVVVEEGVKEDV